MTEERRRPFARGLRALAVGAVLALGIGPLAAGSPAFAETGRNGTGVEQTADETGGGSSAEVGADDTDEGGEPAGTTESSTGGTVDENGVDQNTVDESAVDEDDESAGDPAAGDAQAEANPLADSDAVASAAEPLDGQSDQPAPASQAKQIIGNVHTDAVSAYLDSGKLVLQSKYDAEDGEQHRFDPQQALYSVSDEAKTTIPDGVDMPFLGEAGDTIWLATQVWNDKSIIWPGFSTEDPNLRGKADGDKLKVRLLGVDGPGRAELFLQGTFGIERVFSSQDDLADWTMAVPQHAHMNWGFTKAGSYTFTFEVEAKIGGKTQKAQNEYTFVVGNIDGHRASTTTSLTVEFSEIAEGSDQGKSPLGSDVTLTGEVASGEAGRTPEGAVQFRDEETGAVLGHTPVGADGKAKFRTSELPSGDHRLVAEFVPTWSTDFAVSESEEAALTVAGETKTRPSEDDRTSVSDAALKKVSAGDGVHVTTTKQQAQAGRLVTARVDAAELRGEWVSVWLHAEKPVWLGWAQTNTGGNLSVTVPKGTAVGKHRLVVKNRDGELVGWDNLQVVKASNGGGGSGGSGGDGGGSGGSGGSGGGNGGGSQPQSGGSSPTAAAQQCAPEVTLDHGHIDAFNVSVGGGKAVLQMKEDVTSSNKLREAETVVLRVKEEAYGAVPTEITGGASKGYMLPLAQDQSLVWPGWNTKGFVETSGYTDVSVNITGVDGPGDVFLATIASGFGGWEPILTNGSFALPGTIPIPDPAHTHAAWVFSQKGIYKLTVNAVATNPGTGKSLTTATHTYVFQVGDVSLGDAFCGLAPTAAEDGAAVNAAVRTAGSKASADGASKTSKAAANAKSKQGKNGKNAKGALNKAKKSAEQEALEALLGGEVNPIVVGGVVGGGVLLLAAIAGGTVWFVRRISAA